MSSVEIPTELVERAILDKVSVEIAFSSDGLIASAVNGSASCILSKKLIHIDELVETFLTNNNLHMEEVTVSELKRLLGRLEKSVRAVQRSVAVLEQLSN
jgi:hypothetical protein